MLSEQGFAVLAFSNRGIGDSRNDTPLAELSADLVDWGTLDLPAALDQLIALAPNLPVTLVGHSAGAQDRKSTRLNSSHVRISYAVFCLKKKNKTKQDTYYT